MNLQLDIFPTEFNIKKIVAKIISSIRTAFSTLLNPYFPCRDRFGLGDLRCSLRATAGLRLLRRLTGLGDLLLRRTGLRLLRRLGLRLGDLRRSLRATAGLRLLRRLGLGLGDLLLRRAGLRLLRRLTGLGLGDLRLVGLTLGYLFDFRFFFSFLAFFDIFFCFNSSSTFSLILFILTGFLRISLAAFCCRFLKFHQKNQNYLRIAKTHLIIIIGSSFNLEKVSFTLDDASFVHNAPGTASVSLSSDTGSLALYSFPSK